MKQRYLVCPQCGSPRLFVKNEDGSQTFFHLTWERERVPFKNASTDVQDVKRESQTRRSEEGEGSFPLGHLPRESRRRPVVVRCLGVGWARGLPRFWAGCACR